MATIALTLACSDRSGAPQMGLAFARAFQAAGHKLIIVAPPPADLSNSILRDFAAEGFCVERFKWFGEGPLYRAIWEFCRIVRQNRVECIVTLFFVDSKVAMLSSWFTRVPVVISMQNSPRFCGSKVAQLLKRWVMTGLIGVTRAIVIATSDANRIEALRTLLLPAASVPVVHNGIEMLEQTTPEAKRLAREALGLPVASPVLVNVARLDSQKAQLELVRAFFLLRREFPTARLYLVGGPTPGDTESQRYADAVAALCGAIEAGGAVVAVGWRDDVRLWLQGADLYIQCSRWEGFSLAMLEAMSTGVPVMTSVSANPPDGFTHGTHGFLVDHPDPGAMSTAMRNALSCGEGALKKIGEAGRALVWKQYGISRSTAAMCRIVERTIGVSQAFELRL